MGRRSVPGLAGLIALGAAVAVFSSDALSGESLSVDDGTTTLGVFAFLYGLLHGENLILLLKALAPEAKFVLVAIGAGVVWLGSLFRKG